MVAPDATLELTTRLDEDNPRMLSQPSCRIALSHERGVTQYVHEKIGSLAEVKSALFAQEVV